MLKQKYMREIQLAVSQWQQFTQVPFTSVSHVRHHCPQICSPGSLLTYFIELSPFFSFIPMQNRSDMGLSLQIYSECNGF